MLADKNQLSRGGVVVVLEKIVHPEAEILEVELWKVFAVDRERVEIVVLEIATVLASFLVFSPEKTGREQTLTATTPRMNAAAVAVPALIRGVE